jgi:hypothetical protein
MAGGNCTVKIYDEFTRLPLSRQRKWQLRRKKEGRCTACGGVLATKEHCEYHAYVNCERNKKAYAARRLQQS